MALSARSLITYGLQVTTNNRSLDFKTSAGGPTRLATLNLGYYSITTLCNEIVRAMTEVDSSVNYTASAVRTLNGGIITIATDGPYLSLLFGSGPRIASSISSLIGFLSVDKTGSTSYQAVAPVGIVLMPDYQGYNYVDPLINQEIQGAKLVSASGRKEAVVYQIMQFLEVEYRYEKKVNLQYWNNFFRWAIQQRPFEIIPEVSDLSTYYDVTLDKTGKNQTGMGFLMSEMLPQFPNYFQTGKLIMRLNVTGGDFILP